MLLARKKYFFQCKRCPVYGEACRLNNQSFIFMITKAGTEHGQELSEIGIITFVDAHKASAPAHEIDRYSKEKYNLSYIGKELANPVNIFHIIKHDDQLAGY